MTSGITVGTVLDPTIPDENDTPIKKVTITDRDDAYLAALLGHDLDIDLSGIDLGDIQFEGGDIRGYTPPVPASTRELLLLALAAKLQNIGNKKSVNEPGTLESDADLAEVINKVNTIMERLVDAGVFSLSSSHEFPGGNPSAR